MQRRPKITWRRPLAVLFGLTVLLALDGSSLVRVGLGCAILHESGHALAYRALWGTGRNWKCRRLVSACGCAACP